MIKGSIQEEDIAIINIYAPNIEAPKYTKQILTDLKGEIDSNTVIVGDFNSLLTSMDTSSREKIIKETLDLNNTLDQLENEYIQNISSKNRIHIFLKCTWDIL